MQTRKLRPEDHSSARSEREPDPRDRERLRLFHEDGREQQRSPAGPHQGTGVALPDPELVGIQSRLGQIAEGLHEVKGLIKDLLALVKRDDAPIAHLKDALEGVSKCLHRIELHVRPDGIPRKAWYTTAEVARLVGVHPRTVQNWCRTGRMRYVETLSGRGGKREKRISQEELDRHSKEGLLKDPNRLDRG